MQFLGRSDHQVKIRGHRVEPGEIETVLCQHPLVQDAAVVAGEEANVGKRLLAYVVVQQDRTGIAADLRAFLKDKLPDFMMPSVFMSLERLPLTPSGKVDRRALPKPAAGRPEFVGEMVAPRSSIEKAITGIWTEILGIGAVGITDNFFDLGGHSLLATQVISRIRDVLGKNPFFQENSTMGFNYRVCIFRKEIRC